MGKPVLGVDGDLAGVSFTCRIDSLRGSLGHARRLDMGACCMSSDRGIDHRLTPAQPAEYVSSDAELPCASGTPLPRLTLAGDVLVLGSMGVGGIRATDIVTATRRLRLTVSGVARADLAPLHVERERDEGSLTGDAVVSDEDGECIPRCLVG
jgi:hypothetical protein